MRSREQIMTEWDGVRRSIAEGNTSSSPRDWIEGVMDDQDGAIASLMREIVSLKETAREARMALHSLTVVYNRQSQELAGLSSIEGQLMALLRDDDTPDDLRPSIMTIIDAVTSRAARAAKQT